jgi:hypothetical protein
MYEFVAKRMLCQQQLPWRVPHWQLLQLHAALLDKLHGGAVLLLSLQLHRRRVLHGKRSCYGYRGPFARADQRSPSASAVVPGLRGELPDRLRLQL